MRLLEMVRTMRHKQSFLPLLALFLLAVSFPFFASAQATSDDPSATLSSDPGLYLRVRLSGPIKISKLKTRDIVEGVLSRNVYSADRQLFSSGSRITLHIDHLERRRRTRNDHWPWVVNAFTPRHENFPVFKSAMLSDSTGEHSLQVSLISISRMRDIHAKAKNKDKPSVPQSVEESPPVAVNSSKGKKTRTPTMILEAFDSDDARADDARANNQTNYPADADSNPPDSLPAGTRCKLLLLNSVSASKSKPGDPVHARLLEPVFIESKVVLPAGSIFDGKVIKKTPPKWLSRSGLLYLGFTEVALPNGGRFPIAASLAGAQLDERSHTRMDTEGALHGERPGKAWMAINIGVTAGLAKEVDDTVQLIIEAVVSTATDVSTAGTARIVSSCVSGLYMATRKGRDVVLPRFTEMDVSLDRPASVHPIPEPESRSAASAAE